MRFWVLTIFLAVACRSSGPRQVTPGPTDAPPACGDGHVDPGEECDGSDLAEQNCQTLGYDSGPLGCDATCHFSRALCVKACGNGSLEVTEACDGALGLPACSTFGYQSCTTACTVDHAHCVTSPFDVGPSFFMAKGGAAVIGDLSPPGLGDLVMAVPSFGRVETFPWVVQQGFQQAQGRKLSFEVTPVATWVADVTGDSLNDVLTLNDDGALDALEATGSAFARVPLLDAGCPGGHFLGASASVKAAAWAQCAPHAVVAISKAGVSWVSAADAGAWSLDSSGGLWRVSGNRLALSASFVDGGVTLTDGPESDLPGAPTAFAVADLDLDGDLDVVGVEGDRVELFERTAAGFASKTTFTSVGPRELSVRDIDLDGRPDLVWLASGQLLIRRNVGPFTFTDLHFDLGASDWLSASLGDVDGDGDLDFALTFATGTDSTRTNVWVNRVR